MDKTEKTWRQVHRPSARRLVQLYSALLHNAYERLVNAIVNEDTLATYHEQGRRLGRLLGNESGRAEAFR